METLLGEFELYVQALFNANLHLNWVVFFRLRPYVLHDELLLLCNPVVVTIDDYVDIVAESDHDAIV